jgi:predicted 3-demethylubiquinone-9 3-methyltransferase (glyoxalase superfamily)
MQNIAPCLWLDQNALEAAEFYCSLFPNSGIDCVTHYAEDSVFPIGTVLTVRFSLLGQEFVILHGGPVFQLNPSISLFVDCETEAELDTLWAKLTEGGFVMMELGAYPFSKKFGWVQDRFGLSWQLNLSGEKLRVSPFLMFVGEQHGKAEQAINYYATIFPDVKIHRIERYGTGGPDPEGTVYQSAFSLMGREFRAMDSAASHPFAFNEAVSFYVYCEDQAEIDRLWSAITSEGEEMSCGWMKDKFGVCWQTVTRDFEDLMVGDLASVQRMTDALFEMEKIDIQALRDAYHGK